MPPIILAMVSTLLPGLSGCHCQALLLTTGHQRSGPQGSRAEGAKAWAVSNDRLVHWWFQDPLVGSTRSPQPFSHLFLAILTATVSMKWVCGMAPPAAVQLSINLSVWQDLVTGHWLTAGAKEAWEGGKEGRKEGRSHGPSALRPGCPG